VSSAPVADLLGTIVAASKRAVAFREQQRPLAQLERDPGNGTRETGHGKRETGNGTRETGNGRMSAGARFSEALRSSPAPRVIAECKRRSPSKGILRERYEPATHARDYAAAGAAAISVLTEPTFFDGSPEHLRAVRAAVDVPILRKDFIVSDYQVAEAAWLGADAILLIVGALDQSDLAALLASARRRGLAALVEVHDEEELSRAVDAGAQIVGVNSRNLRTLTVDHQVLERLVTRIPSSAIKVAESGIRSRSDIDRLTAAGYDAFLVGERLIATADPGGALRELRGQ
jgi:indole-3-glycerol phosphate synthase